LVSDSDFYDFAANQTAERGGEEVEEYQYLLSSDLHADAGILWQGGDKDR
jgi:hypothetical protein